MDLAKACYEQGRNYNLTQLLLITGVFSVILCGVQLPYVLLGSFNRFYRDRFSALLGIIRDSSMPSPENEE